MDLVVGGCGYIGSGLVHNLLDLGREVIVCDNHSTGFRNSIPKEVKFTNRNKNNLSRLFATHEIDTVYDLAERSSVKESVEHPEYYLIGNVSDTTGLIRTCMDFKVKNYVYSSSAAVYGNNLICSEETVKNPINPYGVAKSYIEEVLKYSGLNYYILRYFNACGADKDGRYGERHNPETHLIPNVVRSALKKEPINIFGNDFDTVDGTCVRDYIHIDDINQFSIDVQKQKSGIYNLGSGIGFSNKQIVEEVSRILGYSLDVNYLPRREGDPDKLVANISKSKSIGFKPSFNLTDILKGVINYESSKIL